MRYINLLTYSTWLCYRWLRPLDRMTVYTQVAPLSYAAWAEQKGLRHQCIGEVMLNKAEDKASRLRPRPKIIVKKYQTMINNIWFKIISGKINKIPEFYTIFARKMPDCIIRQRDRGQAEAKTSRPRPKLRGRLSRPKFWPWGHFGLEDLTLLHRRHTKDRQADWQNA